MAKRIREKAEARRANKETRPYAKAKYIRMSPSKVRIVLDNIRGQKAEDAVAILANSTQSAAEACLKVLNSAIANAENNKGLNKDELFVAEAYANQAPSFKRVSFRGRGGVDTIIKRNCHITIVLDTHKN